MPTLPLLPSCVVAKPFIKLGNNANAPSLNYNVPQRTSFNAYGNVPIPVTNGATQTQYFTLTARTAPSISFTSDQVKQAIIDLVINTNLTIPQYLTVITPQSLDNLRAIYLSAKKNDPYADFSVYSHIPADTSHTYGGLYSAQDFKNNIDSLAALVLSSNTNAVAVANFGNYGTNIITAAVPSTIAPVLFIIEEYKVSSFLGDYGAGETVNTFSLLPGEKHTITLKSFRQKSSTANRSDNVMDSFSQNSAAEFENLLQDEKQTASNDTTSKSKQSNGTLGLSFKGFSLGASKNKSSGSSSVRSSNTNSLSKALQKHTDSTNSNRTVTVNTTTTETLTETDEESTVRELTNTNLSRVLNFVFRQLLQEYVTITYLNDIKIGFTNGYPDSFRVVNIEELDSLLQEVIEVPYHNDVKQKILNEYATIVNYTGVAQTFLETAQAKTWEGTLSDFLRKKRGLTGNYTYQGADGTRQFKVEGPILNVDLNTLRTDSLIVDALLGQGEALDCFSSQAQNAKTQEIYINNDKLLLEQAKIQLAIDTLNNIDDPAQRADLFAKIFNPQVQNIIS